MSDKMRPKFADILKSIPGFFGIRLEEEPKFTVIDAVDDVEIRRYEEALLAQVTVPGEHDQALNTAFTILAGYIYGQNQSDERLSMTSPVFQQQEDGERMSMTVPVLQSKSGNGWTVSFFLSNDMRVEDAPVPNDASIALVVEPETVLAALRYTGNNDVDARNAAKEQLLSALSRQQRWRVVQDVVWAQYDQPFAIPFLKRNEAHVAVEEL